MEKKDVLKVVKDVAMVGADKAQELAGKAVDAAYAAATKPKEKVADAAGAAEKPKAKKELKDGKKPKKKVADAAGAAEKPKAKKKVKKIALKGADAAEGKKDAAEGKK